MTERIHTWISLAILLLLGLLVYLTSVQIRELQERRPSLPNVEVIISPPEPAPAEPPDLRT